MVNSNYQPLAEFMKQLRDNFKVDICINDFVGFIPLDKELDTVLQPYMAHTNSFCMYVKSDKNLMQKCLAMKKKILSKCIREGQHFYGVCHAGAGELIYPIFHDKQLLGIISIGMFNASSHISGKIIKRMCGKTELDGEKAIELFNRSMNARLSLDREKELNINLNFLCSYLSKCFSKLSEDYHASEHLKKKHNSSEDFILSHCLQHIKNNYRDNIDVATLQALCHCSESFINHIFKKRTGKGVRSYTNSLRIEEAKKLLTNSEDSISNIALKIGFTDPDYFTRVFSKLTGISPKLYRERFRR